MNIDTWRRIKYLKTYESVTTIWIIKDINVYKIATVKHQPQPLARIMYVL